MPLIKCISLTQPYATLSGIGAKGNETRSWRTSHRGPLAIHAAKGFPGWCKRLCETSPFAAALARAGIEEPDQLPRGAIIAIVNLRDCYQIVEGARRGSDDSRRPGAVGVGRM